jgi:hypothetical protein
MPITARFVRLLVIGVPLAFLVYAWTSDASVPVLPESDVSFVSVLDARSSDMEVPRAYGSMAQRPVEGQQPAGGGSFAQLPSVPHLLQHLLSGAGLRDASTQALIISLIGTVLTAILLWRLFAQPALLVVPLAVVLDYVGFLTWTLNASRIWMFVLFFALVLAVRVNKPVWFGVLAFCLIQFDYRIATFVGVTVLTFAMFVHKSKGLRFVAAGLLGAALPLAIFCIEVLTLHGREDLLYEAGVGRAWLGTLLDSRDGLRFLYKAGHGLILLLKSVAQDTHSVPVLLMIVAGVIASLFAMSRDWIDDRHKFVAKLMVSAAVGTLVASSTLHDAFVDGFVNGSLPLASFLIAPAIGALAFELRTLVGSFSKNQLVGAAIAGLVLLPLVLTSAIQLRPAFKGELMDALPPEVRSGVETAPKPDSWLPGSSSALAERTDSGASEPDRTQRRPSDERPGTP